MKSSVFVNGTYAGGHIYGYTPFEVDITALVHEGENEILVRVDNSMQPGSRWYSGSGITRDVWLEKRHPIHIARYGMYLTTDEGNLNNHHSWQEERSRLLLQSYALQGQDQLH